MFARNVIFSILTASLAAGTSLRQARSSAPSQPSLSFDSLKSCQTGYEVLAEQCGKNHLYSSGSLSGTSSEGAHSNGLVDDMRGGSVIRTKSGKSKYGRSYYKAPTSDGFDMGWDYRTMGDDWGDMGECGGSQQSPIDLARYIDVQGQTKYLLWFDYYSDPSLNSSTVGHLVNDGHGVWYKNKPDGVDLGFVKIGREEYAASEYMFHAPSEHSMDGAVFPLELQIYHQTENGTGTVAVAILFREGRSNPFLAALMSGTGGRAPAWKVSQGRASVPFSGDHPEAFDLEKIIPKGDAAKERPFYNYQGSLTQPPCTTGVDWWVLSEPITASKDELRFVRQGIFSSPSMRHGNARSTMPIEDRGIFVGLAGFQHAVKEHGPPAWKHLDEVKAPRGYSSGDVPWGPHGVPKL